MEPIGKNGWNGFRQGFLSQAGDRAWIAEVAVLEPVFVLITVNDTPAGLRERGDTYSRILDSLCLVRP